MATFPNFQPQYSATKRSQPQQRITQFGDGYQQRTTFGLNQDSKVWNLPGTFFSWLRDFKLSHLSCPSS